MSQILTFPLERCSAAGSTAPDAAEIAIARLLDGRDLDRDSACDLFGRLVEGSLAEPLMAAAFVAGLAKAPGPGGCANMASTGAETLRYFC